MEIKINIRRMGKRKPSIVPVVYNLPLGADGFFTVRELITALVRLGVETYHERYVHPELLMCLTREEIDDKAQSGKY